MNMGLKQNYAFSAVSPSGHVWQVVNQYVNTKARYLFKVWWE